MPVEYARREFHIAILSVILQIAQLIKGLNVTLYEIHHAKRFEILIRDYCVINAKFCRITSTIAFNS